MKHGEGAWHADEGHFVQLAARGQLVLRYADDVNGSLGRSPGSSTRPATCSASCPTPSTRSTRSSDQRTEGFCSPPSSTPPPSTSSPPRSRRAWSGASRALEAERLSEHGRTLERRPQPLEVARPHRDGTASRRSLRSCRRSGSGARPPSRLEQLDDDGEPLLARSLRHRHLFEDPRPSPRRRRRRGLSEPSFAQSPCASSLRRHPSRRGNAFVKRLSLQRRPYPRPVHDIVIVGAGTAGCVLASRLTENPDLSVLLIEAGPRSRKLETRIPAAFSKLYRSTARLGRLDGPAARARRTGDRLSARPGAWRLGRDQRDDGAARPSGRLRAWAADGCPGWSWAEAERAFRRSAEGPFPLTEQRDRHVLTEAFVHAAQAAGFPRTTT